ncbi:MAG: putative ATPase, partial [Planctomycetota bacterium]
QAPKSNAIYTGYAAARQDVQNQTAEPVPLHLRNAPTSLMKKAGFGDGYRYAHDDPGAVDEMECLPPGLEGRRYVTGD